jgi:hypothetical protein
MAFIATILFAISVLIQLSYQKIHIISPKALKEKFGKREIKASYSNFGKIPYGFTVIGRVYFDPDDLDSEAACKPLKLEVPKDPEVDQAPIILINRGACNFVNKVQNVEDIGGHVALIVDNKKGENPEFVIMSDDKGRNGEKLRIPGVLISSEDGDIIKEFYRENKNKPNVLKKITLEIEFEMEHPSNIVNYSFFFSSENIHVYESLKELYYFQKHINDTATFTPYYISNRFNYDEEKKGAVDNCYSSGKHCVGPRFDLGITDGRVILKENLRQKCIYKKQNFIIPPYAYWEYMKSYHEVCIGKGPEPKNFTEICALSVMFDLNIPIFEIDMCIKESFGLSNVLMNELPYLENDNSLLDADRKKKNDFDVWLIPSLYVNNRTFWGSWKGENIFEAICAAYKKKPQVCYDEAGFIKEGSGGLSTGMVVLIVLVVLVINLGIFFVCRKFIKEKINRKIEETDINLKINTVVTSYLALKENK